jgi:hypothetical protein
MIIDFLIDVMNFRFVFGSDNDCDFGYMNLAGITLIKFINVNFMINVDSLIIDGNFIINNYDNFVNYYLIRVTRTLIHGFNSINLLTHTIIITFILHITIDFIHSIIHFHHLNLFIYNLIIS